MTLTFCYLVDRNYNNSGPFNYPKDTRVSERRYNTKFLTVI